MKYRYRENGAEATALLFLSKSPSTSTCFQLFFNTLLIHLTIVSCDLHSSKCKGVPRVLNKIAVPTCRDITSLGVPILHINPVTLPPTPQS